MGQSHLGFLIWCLLPSVRPLGIKLTCPEEFKEGINVISCKVNVTAVDNADCLSRQEFVSFDRTVNPPGAMQCYTPSFNSSACIAVYNPVANACWCNKSNGEIFDYVFVYNASHTRDLGAQLECKLCTSPNNPLDVKTSGSCKNLTFEKPSQNSDVTSNPGNLVVIIVSVVIISIITAIIITLVYFIHKKKQRKRNVKAPSSDNGPEELPLHNKCNGTLDHHAYTPANITIHLKRSKSRHDDMPT